MLVSQASPVFAMHIAEGILPVGWASLWFAIALPFIWFGLREIKKRAENEPNYKSLIAMVGAAIFIISCMPIPMPTGTCSHPCGTGLGAILIGPWATVVVASIALLLQALFLAHGGLTTFGADVMSMAVVGAFTGYGTFKLFKKLGFGFFVAAFAAGVISDWATYAMTSFELATALHGEGSMLNMLAAIILAFMPTQIPLGVLEGFVCAGAYKFVRTRRGDLLGVSGEAGNE